ncbi:2955_t:CDS:2, partial [Gigaspora margarita]
MYEMKNYPKSSVIEAKTSCNKFIYHIIQEGIYPNKNILSYTLKLNQYRIPHDYVVETTFGKGKAQKTVICSINYQNNIPEFKIEFIYNNHTELKQISEIRDKHQITRSCKPFSNLSNSMQLKHSTKFGKELLDLFEQQASQTFNNQDNITFEGLTFIVNSQKFYINYNEINNKSIDLQQQAIIRAMDKWAVSNMRQQINQQMIELIPIHLINLNLLHDINSIDNNETDINLINDSKIIDEVTKSIEKGVYQSIKDIHDYIIPSLLEKKIININNPILHIRISGDGRNVGNKVNHIMVTFVLLNDYTNIYHPDHHYTLMLYPGIKKYNNLKIALAPLIKDLNNIINGYWNKQGQRWQIQLYFSADWKFLAICMGHKAANSDHFCLWCTIHKKQNSDQTYDWNISKNINDIYNNYLTIPGHDQLPLFYIILVSHWIVNELHDSESKTWKSTSLNSEDKLKVLKNFNLNILFENLKRASQIRQLWDGFNELYQDIHQFWVSGPEFKKKALDWLDLFLTHSSGNPNSPATFIKGLYRPSDITPYIHTLVFHIPEFLTIHKDFGLH